MRPDSEFFIWFALFLGIFLFMKHKRERFLDWSYFILREPTPSFINFYLEGAFIKSMQGASRLIYP